MAERHPDELDLLDLVESELPRAARGSVAAHVDGCPRCTETVRRLRAGRSALHASGVLQLSERARDEITAAIDREPRRRARRFRFWEPRRLGVVLGLTLVLVASVVAIAQWGGVGTQDDEEAGGDAASVAESGGEEGAGADDDSTAVPESALDPVFVAGPPRAVAAELRADGFDARVASGEVVVSLTGARLSGAERTAEENRLQTVLAELPPGDVVVRVEP
jgi:hypothetical protein